MTVINTFDPTASVAAGSANQTIVLAPGFQRVMMSTTFAGTSMVNFGILIGPNNGVEFSAAASGQFTNKAGGLISSDLASVRVAAQCDIVNEGTLLSSMSHGIAFQGTSNNSSVVNRGDIYGAFGGIAVQSPNAMNLTITNSGQISSDINGLWLTNATGAAPVVINSGVISGRTNAILAENGDRLNVANSGRLVGDVTGKSTGQSDTVTNSGAIVGDVVLGSGSDTYSGNGSVSGTVFGEAGNDKLTGGRFADRLDGGIGIDTIIGGTGRDIMTGGANNDIFRFTALSHSKPGSAADIIMDFDTSGNDRIDMSKLFGPILDFIAGAAFTAPGQIRINDVAGAGVRVEVNTIGTGGADFAISLPNTAFGLMAKNDFVL